MDSQTELFVRPLQPPHRWESIRAWLRPAAGPRSDARWVVWDPATDDVVECAEHRRPEREKGLYEVFCGPHEIELRYAMRLGADDCELAISVSVTVRDLVRFFAGPGKRLLGHSPASVGALAEIVRIESEPVVLRRALEAEITLVETAEFLRVYPHAGWEPELARALEGIGVAIDVRGELRWRCPEREERERLERDAERQRALSRAHEESHEAALRLARLAAEQVGLEADLAAAREATAHERETEHRERIHELRVQERRHEAELRRADLRIEELDRIPERIDALSLGQAELRQSLVTLEIEVGDQRELVRALAEELHERSGVTAAQLRELGLPAINQGFLERVRALESRSQHAIALCLPAAVLTRDVLTRKRVDTVRAGDSLELDLESRRSGYLTLLNVGTSGGRFVLVPNAFVNADAATIAPVGTLRVPDDRLLPARELARHGLEFRECGPSGYEHIVALVSDRPLVDHQVLARASREEWPFYRLDDAALAMLAERIEGSGDAVAAATLSFRVEP